MAATAAGLARQVLAVATFPLKLLFQVLECQAEFLMDACAAHSRYIFQFTLPSCGDISQHTSRYPTSLLLLLYHNVHRIPALSYPEQNVNVGMRARVLARVLHDLIIQLQSPQGCRPATTSTACGSWHPVAVQQRLR